MEAILKASITFGFPSHYIFFVVQQCWPFICTTSPSSNSILNELELMWLLRSLICLILFHASSLQMYAGYYWRRLYRTTSKIVPLSCCLKAWGKVGMIVMKMEMWVMLDHASAIFYSLKIHSLSSTRWGRKTRMRLRE